MIPERFEWESDFDYHKRLIYGKFEDKTLADEDYSELAEIIYGQPYNSDHARKLLRGSLMTLKEMDEEGISSISDESILSELDTKKVELQKERQKFFDQRREYNKIVTADARREHLYQKLAESAERLRDEIGVLYSQPIVDHAREDAEAVLVFSDWHYGMTTNNVFNSYNTEICRQRVARVVEEAEKRIKRHHCRRLHVVFLGDAAHGICHISARVAAEELMADQIMHASEILAQSIQYLSQFVDETRVYLTYGNHGRAVANKNDNIHRDNWERLIGWWLTERFSGEDHIHILPEEADEFLLIDVAGHNMVAAHGDLDNVKSSPRLLSTLMYKMYGVDVEYILLGDKHHRESFNELGVTAVICGSLCGTDDYANSKRLYSDPSQLLLIVTPEDGVDAEYRLKCE